MTQVRTIRGALGASGLVPLDAQVLLAHVVGKGRAWLVAHASDALSREQSDLFSALAARRHAGEPVAYLTGVREFWGLALAVSPAVLIPRPETETLVELALSHVPADRELRVLDLGTGSGALALALAHERPRARVLATDTSATALSIARDNARRLAIRNVEFVESNWYAGLPAPSHGATFDLIVSNPPYVAALDPNLAEGDVRFEPQPALTPGRSGLEAIRAIVAGAPDRLVRGGALAIEHGYDQADAVRAAMDAAGFTQLVAVRDLAGMPRAVAGRVR